MILKVATALENGRPIEWEYFDRAHNLSTVHGQPRERADMEHGCVTYVRLLTDDGPGGVSVYVWEDDGGQPVRLITDSLDVFLLTDSGETIERLR